jgi:DNA adenine methylase
MLPSHTRYVEPFAGSLAVLLAKPPSRHEVVSDIDGDLMVFWKVLRDTPEQLARACMLTPHSRAERKLALERPADLPELEMARRVWSALSQGRAIVNSCGSRIFQAASLSSSLVVGSLGRSTSLPF